MHKQHDGWRWMDEPTDKQTEGDAYGGKADTWHIHANAAYYGTIKARWRGNRKEKQAGGSARWGGGA
jgi:hypothetical protein